MEKTTGYASIDRPSYKYYSEDIDLKILEDTDMKMYDFMKKRIRGMKKMLSILTLDRIEHFKLLIKKLKKQLKL